MLIEKNTLIRIDPEDIIDGVFTAPDDVFYIGNFLQCDCVIKMKLPYLKEIGNDFLYFNNTLKHLYIPNVEKIGYNFLYKNENIRTLDIPNIKSIGQFFLFSNAKFKYTPVIIKALKGSLFIGRIKFNKIEYLRKLNIKKILC